MECAVIVALEKDRYWMGSDGLCLSAMIGDDINTDVGGAQDMGMMGILVKTGMYRRGLVESSSVTPDLTLDSIAELRDLLCE